MHFALRETMLFDGWRRQFAMLLAIGMILGWLGPYGTYGCLDLPDRFALWTLRSLVVGALCLAAFQLLAATGPGASWPPLKQALASVLVASLPSALIGLALAAAFRHPPASPLQIADLCGRAMIVTAVVGIPLLLLRMPVARGYDPRSLRTPATSEGGSGLLRRIPARLGTELLYIEMEDHYLRIHTRLGSDLILYRLSDAVGELHQAIGHQVHRSYWVSRHAVAAVERDRHRTWLVLTSGRRIPVSRTYLPALRAAGWL